MGDVPSTGIRAMDVDQRAILRALGVRTVEVSASTVVTRDGAELLGVLEEALDTAMDIAAPVVLSVPHDVTIAAVRIPPLMSQVASPTASPAVSTVLSPAVSPDSEQDGANSNLTSTDTDHTSNAATAANLDALASALLAAQRPLIIVGRGVVEAEIETRVAQLGEATGALFATSVMARGTTEEQFTLGIAGGFAHRGRLELFRSADLVVVLGASLNRLQVRGGTLFGDSARIVRLTDRPARATAIAVDQEILGDLAETLPELHRAVLRHLQAGTDGQRGETPVTPWREQAVPLPPLETEELDPGCFAETDEEGWLDPRFVLRRLNELLPAERSLVTDGGHFLGWVPKYVQAPDPRATVIVGAAVMTIGLGWASALGVAAAHPDRTTVLIGGDGGMMMGLADAESLFRTARRSVTIILNDAAYGAEVHQYTRAGISAETMLVEDIDYAAISAAFQVPSLIVTDPAQLVAGGEVDRFLRQHAQGNCLLDVKISRVPVADFIKEL